MKLPPRHLADRPDQPRLHAIEGSAALASPAPPSAHQPPPQPANPTSLPALLAVPEPAQPARLGVAIKQPPPVRLSTTLGFRRVSVAVRHSILPAADGEAAPARLAAWCTRRAPHQGDRRGRLGSRRAGRPAPVLPSLPYPVKTLSYPDINLASGDASHRRLGESRRESAGESSVPELLTQQQLANELEVSVRTLERWRREGTGPSWVRVGRSPRYRRQDIDRWLEATRRERPQRE